MIFEELKQAVEWRYCYNNKQSDVVETTMLALTKGYLSENILQQGVITRITQLSFK